MEDITVKEFTSARLSIEKSILNDAIDNANAQDVKDLQENLALAKDLIAQKKIATDINFDFHAILAQASKNKVFIILERAINAIHRELRSRSVVNFKTTKIAVQEHEKILEAIINKDREKAIKLLEKHILSVHNDLVRDT
jgi:DNA-binding GntR family transcriptional regulator